MKLSKGSPPFLRVLMFLSVSHSLLPRKFASVRCTALNSIPKGMTLSYPTPIVFPPRSGKHSSSVIFLHGLVRLHILPS